MKATVLFDLDGTLIDSTEAIVESFCYAFDTFGENPPKRGAICERIGYTLEDTFYYLGVDREHVDEYVKTYKENYRKISREKTFLLDGAAEAIEYASSFARLGIVTTKTARYSKELLEHMNVMRYFETLVGREDVANVKPHEEPILKALSNLGCDLVQKSDVWMIGDTFLDVDAAKNAGIKHVALMTGYGDKEHLKNISDILVDNVLEAVCVIEKNYR